MQCFPRLAVCALFLGGVTAAGAVQDQPAPPAGAGPGGREANVERSLQSVRVDKGPHVDGRLDDAAWKDGPGGGPLIQVTPLQGAPPTEPTEIRVVYDREQLYIGLWCFDSDAAGIVAAEMARDASLDGDDHVTVVLDTFLDLRNGYRFRVNPNGAREDSLISNNVDVNTNWDGIWSARTTSDERGWYCEIAIPFRTLSFQRGSPVWGFNVSRIIKRKYEEDRWSGASDRLRTHNVAEAGRLTGIEGPEPGLGLEVTPYALGKYRNDHAGGDEDLLGDAGADLRYSITPSLTARLSYNTDFAETEVDARQVNLTRFPLFFPEKRELFLEDAGIFDFGGLGQALIPFFSRRVGLSSSGEVVPILAAAKLTGRVGPYNLGVLDAVVDEHDDLPARNAFVGRVSRNLFDTASLGAILTHGDPNSLNENMLAGADFNYRNSRLIEDWVARGNVFCLGTWTEDESGSDNLAVGGSASAESDSLFANVTIYQIGENFNPALGFVPRKDIRAYEAELTFRPLIHSSDWIRRIWVSYFNRHITDLGNELETILHSLTPLYVQFESGDEAFVNTQLNFDAPDQDFEVHPGVVIPAGEYWFPLVRAGLITASKRRIEGRFIYDIGKFYDGEKQTYNTEVILKPIRHFMLGLGYELNQVRLPAGDFDTRLSFVRAQVSFTTDLVWSNLFQYDDLSDTIGWNSRLQWEFRPGAYIYLVLNGDADRNHGRLQAEQAEFTAKIAVTFRV